MTRPSFPMTEDPEPAAVQKATQEYRITSNPVGRFITEWCVVGPRERVGKTALYEGYKAWCESIGWKRMARNKFGSFMKTLFEDYSDGNNRYWIGIGRKTTAEIENGDQPGEKQMGLNDHLTSTTDTTDKLSTTFSTVRTREKVVESLSVVSATTEGDIPAPVMEAIDTYTWRGGLEKRGLRCSVRKCDQRPEWVNGDGEWPLCGHHYNQLKSQSKRGPPGGGTMTHPVICPTCGSRGIRQWVIAYSKPDDEGKSGVLPSRVVDDGVLGDTGDTATESEKDESALIDSSGGVSGVSPPYPEAKEEICTIYDNIVLKYPYRETGRGTIHHIHHAPTTDNVAASNSNSNAKEGVGGNTPSSTPNTPLLDPPPPGCLKHPIERYERWKYDHSIRCMVPGCNRQPEYGTGGGFPLCAGHYEAERRRVLREEVGP